MDRRPYAFNQRDRDALKQFFEPPLKRVREALELVYPHGYEEARNDLHLLYVSREGRRRKRNRSERILTLCFGRAPKLFNYLWGEFEGWDWPTVLERCPNELVPPPSNGGLVLSGGRHTPRSRLLASACWILFANDIPTQLWPETLVILEEHRRRLRWLSTMRQEREKLKRLDQRLAKSQHLIDHVIYARNPSQEPGWEARLEERREDAEIWLHRLEDGGRAHARYHIRPISRDLFLYLGSELSELMSAGVSSPVWSSSEPRDHVVEVDGISRYVRRDRLHGLVLDLIRFSFRWSSYKSFGSGIEPPDWAGDRPVAFVASPRDERAKQSLIYNGEQSRREMAARIKSMLT